MDLKTLASLCLSASALAVFPALSVAAAPTVLINDATGDPHAVSVTAGTPFDVTLQLQSDTSFSGYSIYLGDASYSSGTAKFTITNRTSITSAGGNPFTDPNTTPSSLFNNDPIKQMTRDLGYGATDANAQPGTFNLMTLQITPSASLQAGQSYVFSLNSSSVLLSNTGQEIPFQLPSNYTVTVVPEPTLLGGLAAFGLLTLRRTRRASR